MKPNEIKSIEATNFFKNKVNWKFERKVDGSRFKAERGNLISERGLNRNNRFGQITSRLRELNLTDLTLDGEVYIEGKTILDLNCSENWKAAKFCVFDILSIGDRDLTNKPLAYRQELLKSLIKDGSMIHLPESWSDFEQAWEVVKSRKLEGLIAKNLSSRYEDKRSNNWLKIKLKNCMDVEVIGYEAGKGHGTFLIRMPSGVTGRLSGTSLGIVNYWKQNKPAKCEINYMFLTKEGLAFQPTFSKWCEV